jgi:hypothetical protein
MMYNRILNSYFYYLKPLVMKNALIILSFSVTVLAAVSCQPAHIQDTQLGDWLQAASIGLYPRSNAVCFVIGTTAYVGLGYNENAGGSGRLKDFWSFSVDSGWTQLTDFPGIPRSNAAAFSLGDYGYVGTGFDGLNTYNDFYRYDPPSRQWTARASYPGGPRYDAIAFGIQGKGYMGTGFNLYWMNDLYQYDPQKDSWSLTPGTSGNFSKRRGAVSFVYQDKAFIVTGSNSGGMCRDLWVFDPSRNAAWTRLNDITNTNTATFDDGYSTIEREYGATFVNGSFAFLATGRNGSMVTSTWAYDINHDRWAQRSPYPRSPRFGSVAFTVSGKSFLGTGNTGNNSTFDDFDQFIPDVPFNVNDY